MAPEEYHSTSVKVKVWEWLSAYKESRGLRSVGQAIEFLIKEAGYDWRQPFPEPVKTKGEQGSA